MSKSCLSIVVADDHPVVLRGIVEVLQSSRNMKVVATCSDGTTAMEAIRAMAPDVAVLDIVMPGVNGVEVLTNIATDRSGTKVVFLTATVPDEQILAAMSRGAKAIMFKDTAPDDLVECVRKVHQVEHGFRPIWSMRPLNAREDASCTSNASAKC